MAGEASPAGFQGGQVTGALKDVFGAGNTQTGSGHQQTVFNVGDEARYREGVSAVERQAPGLRQLFEMLSGQAGSSVPRLNTNAGLNTNFQAPQFSNTLDPLSKALVSQGQQANHAQVQGQQQQLSQQFKNNPILAKILGTQVAAQGQLANNPLMFQAIQGQDQRAVGRADAQNQAINYGNNAQLTNANFGNNAALSQFGLGQSARGEQANYGQQSYGVTQGIAQLLQQLGQQFATTHSQQDSGGQGGGLLSGLFG